jgi:DNA-binding protein HU-beta
MFNLLTVTGNDYEFTDSPWARASKTGIEKGAVQNVVENFMEVVKNAMAKGENVYLRGFGSFIIKTRAEKTGRNIGKNIAITIPAHKIPAFKPAKTFMNAVK